MGYVIVAVVFALIPIVVFRPWVGAVLYTVLAYLRPHDLAGDGISEKFRVSLVVLGAMSAGLALGWMRRRVRPVTGLAWYGLVAAMAAAMFVSTRTAIDVHAATSAWLRFLQMLSGVGMTIALCGTPERMKSIVIAIALSIGAVAIWSLAVPHWDDGRLAGTGKLADANDFALLLTMSLPLLIFLRRHETRRWLRWSLAFPIPFVLVAVVMSYSRGGFLALSVVGMGWVLFSRGRMIRLMLAPIAAMLFFALAPASYIARITTIHDYAHDQSALDRLSSWRVATRIFEQRPWTGVGPGNFLAAYRRYRVDFQKPHVAHNAWLQITADSGVVTAAFFSVLILAAFASAQRLGFHARVTRRRLLDSGQPAARERAERLCWIDDYAQGISLSLAAFAVGAQFLSKDNLDLVYLLCGLSGTLALFGWREIDSERVTCRVTVTPRLPLLC